MRGLGALVTPASQLRSSAAHTCRRVLEASPPAQVIRPYLTFESPEELLKLLKSELTFSKSGLIVLECSLSTESSKCFLDDSNIVAHLESHGSSVYSADGCSAWSRVYPETGQLVHCRTLWDGKPWMLRGRTQPLGDF